MHGGELQLKLQLAVIHNALLRLLLDNSIVVVEGVDRRYPLLAL
jgi:hypothetical protein